MDPIRARTGRGALIGGGTLTALSRAYIQIAQLITFIAAGRVLGPAEFGIYALVSAVAFIALKIAEAGWSDYIMAWSGPPSTVAEVYGLSWISGALLAVIGLCAAGVMSFFLTHTGTLLLIAGFALWIALATPSTALMGVMIRRGQFSMSALLVMLAETVGLIVTLIALQRGQAVLSLIIGRLAAQLVYLLLAQVITKLAPSFRTDAATFRDVARFSGNILLSRLIANLRLHAATFIVGGFLGPAFVGFFRAGQRLTGALAEIVGEPARVLAWNSFRQARDTEVPGAIGRQAAIYFPILAIIAIPGFITLALFGEDIVVGLLGPDWAPTAPVMTALSVASLLLVMGNATEPLLSLTRNSHLLPRLYAVYAVIGIGLTFAVAPFGMIPIAIAQIAVAVIIFITNLWIYRSKAGIRWRPVLHRLLPAIIPILLSTAALIWLDGRAVLTTWNPAVRLLVLALPVLALYVSLLAAFYLPLLGRLQRDTGENA